MPQNRGMSSIITVNMKRLSAVCREDCSEVLKMLTHEINHACYKCICRVCGQAGCPHRNGKYKRCVGCWQAHKFRPILDCANFYMALRPKYTIRRVHSKPKVRYVDKTNADDVRVMLTEILRILRPDSATATADINCTRNKCICLTCPIGDRCKDRCCFCTKYKGQHPVRLCGRRRLIERG